MSRNRMQRMNRQTRNWDLTGCRQISCCTDYQFFSCRYIFQIYCITMKRIGWKMLILHDDKMRAGVQWDDDNIALSFWFHTFLAANAMHCISAIRGHFLFVCLFSVLIFSSQTFGENYFPFVEKHFLFFAQARNCWMPAGKWKYRFVMRMCGYMRIQRYEDYMRIWWCQLEKKNTDWKGKWGLLDSSWETKI